MASTFGKWVSALKKTSIQFDESANQRKLELLVQLSKEKLKSTKSLLEYFEVLLYTIAYPPTKKVYAFSSKELLRISQYLKKSRDKESSVFINSGLPFTNYESCFSFDLVEWLINHPACNVEWSNFEEESFSLNDILRLTLPSLERSETTAGINNVELLDALKVNKKNRLQFLINQISWLDAAPGVKDSLYNELGVYVKLTPTRNDFSRAYNRLPIMQPFLHNELLKHFDFKKTLNKQLPRAIILSRTVKEKYIEVVKKSMAITDRETDPVTYMEENSFRVYHLERGISIAIYGMVAQRQLPLESYVGYTLFKNGFPAAYGGAWVFGEVANFGINIFESFGGGESGYFMCQLLRVYKNLFKINYFEIEAYQFGLDNPEGIESGAFWFYYRYGFRPLDKELLRISISEHKKQSAGKQYRTNEKILKKFTASNIALVLGKQNQIKVSDITVRVTRMIAKKYNGDRQLAVEDSVAKFCNKARMKFVGNDSEKKVLQEIALWAAVMKINDLKRIKLLKQMVKVKPVDVYKYQQLLLQYFST